MNERSIAQKQNNNVNLQEYLNTSMNTSGLLGRYVSNSARAKSVAGQRRTPMDNKHTGLPARDTIDRKMFVSGFSQERRQAPNPRTVLEIMNA
jgi:hypothetical protein